jgi:hypothetical protein
MIREYICGTGVQGISEKQIIIMSTPLSALSNILSSGIATIESTYAKHGATFPSIDVPFQPGPLDADEALCETINQVIAAAAQLIALVKPAPRTAIESALSVSGCVINGRSSLLTFIAQAFPRGEYRGCCSSKYPRDLTRSRTPGMMPTSMQALNIL